MIRREGVILKKMRKYYQKGLELLKEALWIITRQGRYWIVKSIKNGSNVFISCLILITQLMCSPSPSYHVISFPSSSGRLSFPVSPSPYWVSLWPPDQDHPAVLSAPNESGASGQAGPYQISFKQSHDQLWRWDWATLVPSTFKDR